VRAFRFWRMPTSDVGRLKIYQRWAQQLENHVPELTSLFGNTLLDRQVEQPRSEEGKLTEFATPRAQQFVAGIKVLAQITGETYLSGTVQEDFRQFVRCADTARAFCLIDPSILRTASLQIEGETEEDNYSTSTVEDLPTYM
jgi:hypothetical protein